VLLAVIVLAAVGREAKGVRFGERAEPAGAVAGRRT
jgi:hypothetical protein